MNRFDFHLKNFRQPFLIAAALAFVYAAVLTKLLADWWTDENYSHGLLVPFVIGYIIYTEFGHLQKQARKPQIWIGGALAALALLMLLGGTLGAELFTQRISLIVMLAGITIYFFGAKILKMLAVPFALLLLAIPIPQILFNKFAFPLQIYASQAAVWGIRLFEVPSVRKGNVIEILPHGAMQTISLEVVEACSGIRSLMTLMTLALILAYFTRMKTLRRDANHFNFLRDADFWRGLILMLAAIPIAILTNAARVTATGILTFYYGKQATESSWHEFSGWLVYLVALALLIAVNVVLKKVQGSRFKVQSPSEIRDAESIHHSSFIIHHSAWILAAVLIFGGFFVNWFNQRGEAAPARKSLSEFPAVLGDWRQKGDEVRFGEQTESVLRTTDYTMREYVLPDGRLANLYVGYYASQRTGATYHSPQNCLPGAGWVMRQPEFVEIETPAGKTFTANKFTIENGVYNEVLIYWYQGRGRATASEYADKINTIRDSILRRRTDGALVRVMTSIGGDEAEATKQAIALAAQAADNLGEFVPN